MDRPKLVEAVRQRLVRLPTPYDHAFGIVPLPPPVEPPVLRPVLGRLEAAIRAMERVQTLASEMKSTFLISRVLPRREAVASSAIEQTFSTLDELLADEEEQGLEDNASDTALVRDYATTLEELLPEAAMTGRSIFTPNLVQRLHRRLMQRDKSYRDIPGEFRKRAVWIGAAEINTSIYNPPPPSMVEPCLGDTLSYMRCDKDEDLSQALITRMAISHAHFEAVHPFRDGNGRAGRLLLPLMMAAEGRVPLYLSPYIESHKARYGEALKAAQQRLELHEIVGFMCDAVVATVEDLVEMRAALEKLRGAWESRRRFRRSSASLRALDLLTDYPVLTAARLAALLDVSVPQAHLAVNQLVKVGILKERTGYVRNRVFVAKEVLDTINRQKDWAAA